MPFVSNMQDSDEKKDPSLAAQGPVAPTGTGGGAVHLAPSAAVAPIGGSGAPGSGGPGAAGGQFASLNQYLNANQGQAEPLAGKLTAGIGQQYTNLANQNTSTLGDINKQVAANALPANANDVLAQEAADPVSFTGNAGNIPSFQKLLNASYSGPTSAESTTGFSNQQNAINNAISAGQQATKTEAGRENLLAQNEATPTTGVTALNSAILSQSPEALGNVESAYQPFSGLLTDLSKGAEGINKNIAQTQGTISSTNTAANKQIADQIAALNTNVNNEYSALQNKYNAANTEAAALTSSLQNGKLPVGYGIDPGLQAFINNNINPWFAANAPGVTNTYNFANAMPQLPTNQAPTLPQAATAQDYAQAQAFQSLLAGLPSGPAAPIISPDTAAQAGTYNVTDIPAINNQALAGDIYSGLSAGTPVQVAAGPYHQFLDLLAALNKYQGLPGGTGPGGPGYNGSVDIYGNPIPVIA